jgi:5-methylcytosine-specific restriction endonuclease McrA
MHHKHTPDAPQLKQCTKCREFKPATAEFFTRAKRGKFGFRAQCKACERAYRVANREHRLAVDRAYHAANRERRNAESHAYHEANKERSRAKNRAWAAANAERNREAARSYYAANKDKVVAYRRANADAIREWKRADRARKRQEKEERERQWREDHPQEYEAQLRGREERQKERISRKNRLWRINNREASRAKDTRRRIRKMKAEGNHTGDDIKRQYKAQKGRCYYCGVKVGQDYHVDHVIPLSRGGSNGPENIVISCPFCNQSKKDKMPHEWNGSNRLL